MTRIDRLAVRLEIGGEDRSVGTLAWDRARNTSAFQYHADFLGRPLPVSPFNLPSVEGLCVAPHDPFAGLHGLFHDSLPDGWGSLLLERRMRSLGIQPGSLTPLDRLAFVGANGMGALSYAPERDLGGHRTAGEIDLDYLSQEVGNVEAEVEAADVERLLDMQGGSGGARPKIVVVLNDERQTMRADHGRPLTDGESAWIVKFASRHDPSEMGVEEYAYSLMARDAGIDIPSTKLVETAAGGRFFAVERFDRTLAGRDHVHTVSGMLHASHRYSSIDYRILLNLTRKLTRDERQVHRMFRRLAFNVFAHNRDDHSKNHAFKMDASGNWSPTPAYDLTFSAGPGGYHSLQISDENGDPSLEHVFRAAETAAIPKKIAAIIVDEVRHAVDRWPEHAEHAGLSERRAEEMDFVLNGRGPEPRHDITVADPSPMI